MNTGIKCWACVGSVKGRTNGMLRHCEGDVGLECLDEERALGSSKDKVVRHEVWGATEP